MRIPQILRKLLDYSPHFESKRRSGNIRELKQRRFWATHVYRKCAFSLFIYLDSNKFILLSFFSLIMRIYLRVSTKPLPSDAKRLLPVEVRRSKTLLLKLPIIYTVAGPDLQIRWGGGGGGHPDPEISGGRRRGRSENFFSALRTSVWSKNMGGGGCPGPFTRIRHCIRPTSP